MLKLKRILLVLFIMVLSIGCDQVTKQVATSHLSKTRYLSFANDTLRLDYTKNEGGVLSFEHYMPERWRGKAFSEAVAALCVLILICLIFISALKPLAVIGLSLTLAGISSNLFDRVAFGYVVDFLNFGWGDLRSGIFNAADAEIVCGLSLFALSLVWNFGRWALKKPSAPYRS